MADAAIAITPGSGAEVDVRTEDVNGNSRQVVVIGDPTANTGVAAVDGTAGLKVNLGSDNDVTVTGNLTTVSTVSAVTNVATVGTSVTPGTSAAHLGKAEDAAHTTGDTGVMALAVRNDAGTAVAGTTGDYIPLTTNSSGHLWVAGGGGTQFEEDTAHTSGDTGTMMLAVRRDANTSLVTSDGDYAPLQVGSTGALKVDIASGGGTGGTSANDEAAFTEGSSSTTPVAGYYNSSEDTLSSGVTAAIGIDSARNVKTHEQYAPLAEDNTNQVIATQVRPVSGSTYSPSLYAPMTQVTKNNIKSSAGNVKSIYITNANAAVRYFQLHNKATSPAGTDVPYISLPIPAGTANNPGVLSLGSEFFTIGGRYHSTGIGWAVSTTLTTFTDSATNTEHIVVVNYI